MLDWQDFIGTLVPSAVTALVLLAAWRRSRRRWSARESRSWAGAPALAAGFVAGFLILFGWPGLPPWDAVDWVLFLAVPLAVVGVAEAALRVAFPGRALAASVAVPGSFLLVAWPLLPASGSDDVGPLLLGATAATVATMLSAELLAERTSAARQSAVMLAVAAPAAVVLLLSGSARLGMIGGCLAAAAAGALAANVVLGRAALGRGTVVVFGTLLAALVVSGMLYSHVRPGDATLLAIAPNMAWLGRFAPRRFGWTVHTLIYMALVLAVASAPAVRLWMEPSESPW